MSNIIGAYITGLFDSEKSCKSAVTAKGIAESIMTDYIFWSIHVDPKGNLYYNNVKLVTDGVVSSDAECLKNVVDMGRESGKLERVWLSIGAGGTQDFTNINTILNACGAEKDNLLCNFKVISDYLGVHGFDYDNEDMIGNVEVIVNLTKVLHDLDKNYRFSFCPYGASQYFAPYWIKCLQGFYSTLKTQPVVGFNLQCYSGGANSDPIGWMKMVNNSGINTTGVTDANAFIRPGLAVAGSPSNPAYTPSQMTSKLDNWNSLGAWIWHTENVLNFNEGNPTIADYASAIMEGVSIKAT